MSVCLSVRSIIACVTPVNNRRSSSKKITRTAEVYQIVYACCPFPWLGPPLAALRYVVYIRFCGWRHIFSTGPMARHVYSPQQQAQQPSFQPNFAQQYRSASTYRELLTGTKSDIYACLVCVSHSHRFELFWFFL